MKRKLKYLYIQSQPSQLDAIFYGDLARLIPDETLVILFNNSGNQRHDADPELGFTPIFPDFNDEYPTEWIASGAAGLTNLLKRITQLRPACVVLQDQKWREKIIIAVYCKLMGICVAMRSDKNFISSGARTGFSLWIERFLVAQLFNVLCPVSELTTSYYNWSDSRLVWLFPYSTNRNKFDPSINKTSNDGLIRLDLKIPEYAFVFLTVAKFVDRENPRGVIDAFKHVVKSYPNAWLLMVGAGPQLDEIQQYVDQIKIPNIIFTGYVPYVQLEQYFFSSNVFLHFAKQEPWGISPQDALVAGMGLITSDKVGSSICHLGKGLCRFVVSLNDINVAVERMAELIVHGKLHDLFQPAKANVLNGYTTESLALLWAHRSLKYP